MNIIFLLVGVSLTVAILFLGAFLWNVKTGQYEDDYTPSVRMLFEEGVNVSDQSHKKNTNPDKDISSVKVEKSVTNTSSDFHNL